MVRQNHFGRIHFKAPANHLYRINTGAIYGAVEHLFKTDQTMLIVEKHHSKNLPDMMTHLQQQKLPGETRVTDRFSALQASRQVTLADLQGSGQLRVLGDPNTRLLQDFLTIDLHQASEAIELNQQTSGQLQDRQTR